MQNETSGQVTIPGHITVSHIWHIIFRHGLLSNLQNSASKNQSPADRLGIDRASDHLPLKN